MILTIGSILVTITPIIIDHEKFEYQIISILMFMVTLICALFPGLFVCIWQCSNGCLNKDYIVMTSLLIVISSGIYLFSLTLMFGDIIKHDNIAFIMMYNILLIIGITVAIIPGIVGYLKLGEEKLNQRLLQNVSTYGNI